jgi:hypothetical protein
MKSSRLRDSSDAALAAALPLIARISRTAAEETEAIASGGVVPYEAFSRRKAQGLLELNRLAPALGRAPAAPDLRVALNGMNACLEANRRALKVQLEASIAVADIIARAIRDGQSDGTYTAQAWKRPPE